MNKIITILFIFFCLSGAGFAQSAYNKRTTQTAQKNLADIQRYDGAGRPIAKDIKTIPASAFAQNSERLERSSERIGIEKKRKFKKKKIKKGNRKGKSCDCPGK